MISFSCHHHHASLLCHFHNYRSSSKDASIRASRPSFQSIDDWDPYERGDNKKFFSVQRDHNDRLFDREDTFPPKADFLLRYVLVSMSRAKERPMTLEILAKNPPRNFFARC